MRLFIVGTRISRSKALNCSQLTPWPILVLSFSFFILTAKLVIYAGFRVFHDYTSFQNHEKPIGSFFDR